MAFDGTEGDAIDLAMAAGWTATYRDTDPGGVKAHFFGRDILTAILEQEGCMGIRIYYAMNDAGEKCLVLVGADASEADQVNGIVAEMGQMSPPYSAFGSPLDQ